MDKNQLIARGEGAGVDVGFGMEAPPVIKATYPGGDEYPVDIEVELVLDGRRYVVEVLTLRRQAGGVSVTGEHIRKIPVQSIVQEVVKGLTWARPFGRKEPAKLTRQEIEAIVKAGPTDETLEWVSKIYVVAELAGEPPARSVRDLLGIPASTANVWIRRAKDRGILNG